jgi:hypothetical protein
MLLTFSQETAQLLKDQIPCIGELTWRDENELDLISIKQLKGCRTQLVQDCLKTIQDLDNLSIDSSQSDEWKNFLNNSRQSLIENLKKYLKNCERYPRIKNFLNIIPDNTSGMVSFIIVLSIFITVTSHSPFLAIIPVSVFIWVLIDLIFNNRSAVENLKTLLFTIKNKLGAVKEACHILSQHAEVLTTTPLLAESTPSTSRNYRSSDTPPLVFQAEVHQNPEDASNHSNFSL